MRTRFVSRGFSLLHLAIALFVIVIAMACLLVVVGRNVSTNRQLRDSTQVRGIHQGMVLWPRGDPDSFPLPSFHDRGNQTVADQGRAKDTTANILSILIYNNFFSPELCVSSAEANPAIRFDAVYAFSEPPTAVNPQLALWDPAFSADFTGGKTGNVSFALMLPANERLRTWTNDFQASEAVVGNRGPLITGFATKNGARVYAPPKTSNTFLIHGGRTTWEGNIAYNDNHVNFETSVAPEMTTYKDAADATQRDCLFLDETDDASRINNFLGIFVTAGETKAEYGAILD